MDNTQNQTGNQKQNLAVTGQELLDKGSKCFFHVDVNSAFLSWSALSEFLKGNTVDLRTVPSIVGGDIEKRHGIVLAKSIPAKAYGIETGEPVANALRKCPFLTIVSPDGEMYRKQSHLLMDYLAGICPDLEKASIDECYLDFTGCLHLYKTPLEAGEMICDQVYKRFGFTVNVGISDRKVLAKMASDFEKPSKVHTLFSSEIREKMWPLPVSDLFLCGKSSAEVLRKLEILTIGDLARTSPDILKLHLKSHGQTLWNFANGIDDSGVEQTPAPRKGVGHSTTLEKDLRTCEEAAPILLKLCEEVTATLRSMRQNAGQVTVEIRYSTFQDVSHQMNLEIPTNDAMELYKSSMHLFHALWNGEPVRLLGVRATKFSPEDAPVQLSLFDAEGNFAFEMPGDRSGAIPSPEDSSREQSEAPSEQAPAPSLSPSTSKQQKLNAALDSIRGRYGKDAIKRGSLLGSPDTPK